jgi:hypothetical protein
MTALSLSTRILTRRFSSFLYAGVNDFLESSYVYRSKSNNPKTNQLYSDRLIDRLEWLSPKAPGKESGTRKRVMEQHCSRSSSSHNNIRKKGGGQSPLPSVFSLHPASSDVHDTATRGACFPPPAASRAPQTRAWVEVEKELNRQWVEEDELDQSISDRWTLDVQEGGAGGVSSGPRSEVRGPHHTGTGPALPLVHLQRGHCHGRREATRWRVRPGDGRASELDGAPL